MKLHKTRIAYSMTECKRNVAENYHTKFIMTNVHMINLCKSKIGF